MGWQEGVREGQRAMKQETMTSKVSRRGHFYERWLLELLLEHSREIQQDKGSGFHSEHRVNRSRDTSNMTGSDELTSTCGPLAN